MPSKNPALNSDGAIRPAPAKPHDRRGESSDRYSETETEARREAALRRMLATPHRPHQPIGKPGTNI